MNNNNEKLYTIIAFIIGYSLIDYFNPSEQNAIGNWLMLISQVLETSSAIATVNTTNYQRGNNSDPLKTMNECLNIMKDTFDKL